MLTRLEMLVKSETDDENITFHYGSLLHGYLMDTINPELADKLHANELKPFSQYIAYERQTGAHRWILNSLTRDAREGIILPMYESSARFIPIEHKNIRLEVLDKELKQDLNYKELAEEYYLSDNTPSRHTIVFNTPATFKINGRYCIFPPVKNIYESLLNKWNTFNDGLSLQDADLENHLNDHTEIIGYNLKSTRFGIENVRIRSFIGEIALWVSGPRSLKGIAALLFAYGEYAGIGAKTALGMGGVRYGKSTVLSGR